MTELVEVQADVQRVGRVFEALVRCPFCGREHRHAAGPGTLTLTEATWEAFGPRLAHCGRGSYRIALVGSTPDSPARIIVRDCGHFSLLVEACPECGRRHVLSRSEIEQHRGVPISSPYQLGGPGVPCPDNPGSDFYAIVDPESLPEPPSELFT
ncbi:MAG: hypothetical protein ACRDJV_04825 [Actinomycetota bacterium]